MKPVAKHSWQSLYDRKKAAARYCLRCGVLAALSFDVRLDDGRRIGTCDEELVREVMES